MTLFAFSGSLRTGSFNTRLLEVAVKALLARGVEVDVWDFKAANIPVFDPDTSDTNQPASLTDFKARVAKADGLLLACPEYNYSYPGSLKNLFDFASRPKGTSPFAGKLAAQLGATPGPGGTLQAQVMLRHVLSGLGMVSVPGAFTVSRAGEAFAQDGSLKDEKQQQSLGAFLDRVVAELTLRAPR